MKSWIIIVFSLISISIEAQQLNKVYLNHLLDAIYLTEGGANTKYPYGVIGDFKKSPRIIAANTIKHNYNNWLNSSSKTDFLRYLQQHYCPINAKNDPNHLNDNWYKNVSLIMKQYE